MTVFHLLRHGEPSVFGRINGRLPGVGLSAKGRAEIGAVAGRLAGEKIDAIYASPLQRTRETAEILSDRLALPIQYREDVIELDFGSRIEVGLASLSTIRLDGSGIRVLALNDCPRPH